MVAGGVDGSMLRDTELTIVEEVVVAVLVLARDEEVEIVNEMAELELEDERAVLVVNEVVA